VLAEREFARAGGSLDHGGAFPVLTGAFVIVQGGNERDRDRRRSGVGTQAQIGAEHVPVSSAFLHQLDETAREPDEEAAGLSSLKRRRICVVKNNEIDIA